MLGKLFKHEFKSTYKLMLTIYGVTLIVSLLGAVALFFGMMDEAAPPSHMITGFITGSYVILYVLTVFALFVITYVYMCVHFYKTMYSSQGYLTHTLPVNPITTFHVKLAVSFIWTISSILVLILSIFILLYGISHGDIVSSINTMLSSNPYETLGCGWGTLFAYILFILIFSCLSYLLMVFSCLSIGQLFSQNKIVFSIVAGIVIYLLQQIVNTIVVLAVGGTMLFAANDSVNNLTFANVLFSPFMLASFVCSILFIIAFYVTCVVIVKKHINLD